jgi:hypothetical protein
VRDHACAGHGTLEFNRDQKGWRRPHSDPTLQQMADCYLKSYFGKRGERGDQPTA